MYFQYDELALGLSDTFFSFFFPINNIDLHNGNIPKSSKKKIPSYTPEN